MQAFLVLLCLALAAADVSSVSCVPGQRSSYGFESTTWMGSVKASGGGYSLLTANTSPFSEVGGVGPLLKLSGEVTLGCVCGGSSPSSAKENYRLADFAVTSVKTKCLSPQSEFAQICAETEASLKGLTVEPIRFMQMADGSMRLVDAATTELDGARTLKLHLLSLFDNSLRPSAAQYSLNETDLVHGQRRGVDYRVLLRQEGLRLTASKLGSVSFRPAAKSVNRTDLAAITSLPIVRHSAAGAFVLSRKARDLPFAYDSLSSLERTVTPLSNGRAGHDLLAFTSTLVELVATADMHRAETNCASLVQKAQKDAAAAVFMELKTRLAHSKNVQQQVLDASLDGKDIDALEAEIQAFDAVMVDGDRRGARSDAPFDFDAATVSARSWLQMFDAQEAGARSLVETQAGARGAGSAMKKMIETLTIKLGSLGSNINTLETLKAAWSKADGFVSFINSMLEEFQRAIASYDEGGVSFDDILDVIVPLMANSVGIKPGMCENPQDKTNNCLPDSPGLLYSLWFGNKNDEASKTRSTPEVMASILPQTMEFLASIVHAGNEFFDQDLLSTVKPIWLDFKSSLVAPVLTVVSGFEACQKKIKKDWMALLGVWDEIVQNLLDIVKQARANTPGSEVAKALVDLLKGLYTKVEKFVKVLSSGVSPIITALVNLFKTGKIDLGLCAKEEDVMKPVTGLVCAEGNKNCVTLSGVNDVIKKFLADPAGAFSFDKLTALVEEKVKSVIEKLGNVGVHYEHTIGTEDDFIQFTLYATAALKTVTSEEPMHASVNLELGVQGKSEYFDMKIIELAWRPRLEFPVLKVSDLSPIATLMGEEVPLTSEFSEILPIAFRRGMDNLIASVPIGDIVFDKMVDVIFQVLQNANGGLGSFLAPPAPHDDPAAAKTLVEVEDVLGAFVEVESTAKWSVDFDQDVSHDDRHYIPSHPRLTSSPLHARAHAAHILVELDTNQDLSVEQRHELQQQSLALQSLARQPSAFSLMETRVVGGKSGSLLSGLDEIQRVVGIVSNYVKDVKKAVHKAVSEAGDKVKAEAKEIISTTLLGLTTEIADSAKELLEPLREVMKNLVQAMLDLRAPGTQQNEFDERMKAIVNKALEVGKSIGDALLTKIKTAVSAGVKKLVDAVKAQGVDLAGKIMDIFPDIPKWVAVLKTCMSAMPAVVEVFKAIFKLINGGIDFLKGRTTDLGVKSEDVAKAITGLSAPLTAVKDAVVAAMSSLLGKPYELSGLTAFIGKLTPFADAFRELVAYITCVFTKAKAIGGVVNGWIASVKKDGWGGFVGDATVITGTECPAVSEEKPYICPAYKPDPAKACSAAKLITAAKALFSESSDKTKAAVGTAAAAVDKGASFVDHALDSVDSMVQVVEVARLILSQFRSAWAGFLIVKVDFATRAESCLPYMSSAVTCGVERFSETIEASSFNAPALKSTVNKINKAVQYFNKLIPLAVAAFKNAKELFAKVQEMGIQAAIKPLFDTLLASENWDSLVKALMKRGQALFKIILGADNPISNFITLVRTNLQSAFEVLGSFLKCDTKDAQTLVQTVIAEIIKFAFQLPSMISNPDAAQKSIAAFQALFDKVRASPCMAPTVAFVDATVADVKTVGNQLRAVVSGAFDVLEKVTEMIGKFISSIKSFIDVISDVIKNGVSDKAGDIIVKIKDSFKPFFDKLNEFDASEKGLRTAFSSLLDPNGVVGKAKNLLPPTVLKALGTAGTAVEGPFNKMMALATASRAKFNTMVGAVKGALNTVQAVTEKVQVVISRMMTVWRAFTTVLKFPVDAPTDRHEWRSAFKHICLKNTEGKLKVQLGQKALGAVAVMAGVKEGILKKVQEQMAAAKKNGDAEDKEIYKIEQNNTNLVLSKLSNGLGLLDGLAEVFQGGADMICYVKKGHRVFNELFATFTAGTFADNYPKLGEFLKIISDGLSDFTDMMGKYDVVPPRLKKFLRTASSVMKKVSSTTSKIISALQATSGQSVLDTLPNQFAQVLLSKLGEMPDDIFGLVQKTLMKYFNVNEKDSLLSSFVSYVADSKKVNAIFDQYFPAGKLALIVGKHYAALGGDLNEVVLSFKVFSDNLVSYSTSLASVAAKFTASFTGEEGKEAFRSEFPALQEAMTNAVAAMDGVLEKLFTFDATKGGALDVIINEYNSKTPKEKIDLPSVRPCADAAMCKKAQNTFDFILRTGLEACNAMEAVFLMVDSFSVEQQGNMVEIFAAQTKRLSMAGDMVQVSMGMISGTIDAATANSLDTVEKMEKFFVDKKTSLESPFAAAVDLMRRYLPFVACQYTNLNQAYEDFHVMYGQEDSNVGTLCAQINPTPRKPLECKVAASTRGTMTDGGVKKVLGMIEGGFKYVNSAIELVNRGATMYCKFLVARDEIKKVVLDGPDDKVEAFKMIIKSQAPKGALITAIDDATTFMKSGIDSWDAEVKTKATTLVDGLSKAITTALAFVEKFLGQKSTFNVPHNIECYGDRTLDMKSYSVSSIFNIKQQIGAIYFAVPAGPIAIMVALELVIDAGLDVEIGSCKKCVDPPADAKADSRAVLFQPSLPPAGTTLKQKYTCPIDTAADPSTTHHTMVPEFYFKVQTDVSVTAGYLGVSAGVKISMNFIELHIPIDLIMSKPAAAADPAKGNAKLLLEIASDALLEVDVEGGPAPAPAKKDELVIKKSEAGVAMYIRPFLSAMAGEVMLIASFLGFSKELVLFSWAAPIVVRCPWLEMCMQSNAGMSVCPGAKAAEKPDAPSYFAVELRPSAQDKCVFCNFEVRGTVWYGYYYTCPVPVTRLAQLAGFGDFLIEMETVFQQKAVVDAKLTPETVANLAVCEEKVEFATRDKAGAAVATESTYNAKVIMWSLKAAAPSCFTVTVTGKFKKDSVVIEPTTTVAVCAANAVPATATATEAAVTSGEWVSAGASDLKNSRKFVDVFRPTPTQALVLAAGAQVFTVEPVASVMPLKADSSGLWFNPTCTRCRQWPMPKNGAPVWDCGAKLSTRASFSGGFPVSFHSLLLSSWAKYVTTASYEYSYIDDVKNPVYLCADSFDPAHSYQAFVYYAERSSKQHDSIIHMLPNEAGVWRVALNPPKTAKPVVAKNAKIAWTVNVKEVVGSFCHHFQYEISALLPSGRKVLCNNPGLFYGSVYQFNDVAAFSVELQKKVKSSPILKAETVVTSCPDKASREKTKGDLVQWLNDIFNIKEAIATAEFQAYFNLPSPTLLEVTVNPENLAFWKASSEPEKVAVQIVEKPAGAQAPPLLVGLEKLIRSYSSDLDQQQAAMTSCKPMSAIRKKLSTRLLAAFKPLVEDRSAAAAAPASTAAPAAPASAATKKSLLEVAAEAEVEAEVDVEATEGGKQLAVVSAAEAETAKVPFSTGKTFVCPVTLNLLGCGEEEGEEQSRKVALAALGSAKLRERVNVALTSVYAFAREKFDWPEMHTDVSVGIMNEAVFSNPNYVKVDTKAWGAVTGAAKGADCVFTLAGGKAAPAVKAAAVFAITEVVASRGVKIGTPPYSLKDATCENLAKWISAVGASTEKPAMQLRRARWFRALVGATGVEGDTQDKKNVGTSHYYVGTLCYSVAGFSQDCKVFRVRRDYMYAATLVESPDNHFAEYISFPTLVDLKLREHVQYAWSKAVAQSFAAKHWAFSGAPECPRMP